MKFDLAGDVYVYLRHAGFQRHRGGVGYHRVGRGAKHGLHDMLRHPPPAGSTHCLIMIDIDHFKRVNDTHGHQVGDRVLEGLGTVLRSMPAEPGMACARYGGEEFAILLPDTSLNKAVQMAEAVRSRTRGIRLRNRSTQAVELTVTVSAGVAAWRGRQCLDRLCRRRAVPVQGRRARSGDGGLNRDRPPSRRCRTAAQTICTSTPQSRAAPGCAMLRVGNCGPRDDRRSRRTHDAPPYTHHGEHGKKAARANMAGRRSGVTAQGAA